MLVHSLELVQEVHQPGAQCRVLGGRAGRAAVEGGDGLVDPGAVVPGVVLLGEVLGQFARQLVRSRRRGASGVSRPQPFADRPGRVLVRRGAVAHPSARERLDEPAPGLAPLDGAGLEEQAVAEDLEAAEGDRLAAAVLPGPAPGGRAVTLQLPAGVERGGHGRCIEDVEPHAGDHQLLAVGVAQLRQDRMEHGAGPGSVEERRHLLVEGANAGAGILLDEVLAVGGELVADALAQELGDVHEPGLDLRLPRRAPRRDPRRQPLEPGDGAGSQPLVDRYLVALDRVAERERDAGDGIHDLVEAHRGVAERLEEGSLPGGQPVVGVQEAVDRRPAIVEPAVEGEPEVGGALAQPARLVVELAGPVGQASPELLEGGVVLGAELLGDEPVELGERQRAVRSREARCRQLVMAALLELPAAAAGAGVVAAHLGHAGSSTIPGDSSEFSKRSPARGRGHGSRGAGSRVWDEA